MGSLKEAGGNLIGNEGLKQAGREQNAQGQEQEAKGQLSDLGKGVSDRVTGAVGGAVASLTGDRAGQQKYADQHVSSLIIRPVDAVVHSVSRHLLELTCCIDGDYLTNTS